MEQSQIFKTKFIEKFSEYNIKESIEDDCLEIEIINYEDKNIIIHFDENEIIFFFLEYHMHIYYDDDSFQYLVDITKKVLSSEYVVMVVYSNKRWLCSNLLKFEDVPMNSLSKFLKFCFPNTKEFRNELKNGGKVYFSFWDSSKNMIYKVQDGKLSCEK
ncbi:hypothetical protein [Candidatus Pseudoruminococcus sp.]|uniref:hypothetical protein n=1 Tax=Candidatus Pseudoruminococcus sp. TaxID=3101048 RepID=UPI00399BC18B